MDDKLAHSTNTPDQALIDKYLMNELTPEERLTFEEHAFDCSDCAARVTQDFAMIADLKAFLREEREETAPTRLVQRAKITAGWRDWFRPMTLGPAFAALVLATVVGYQNLVSIPGMLQPQVLDTTPMVSVERGPARQIALQPGAAQFAVTFEVSSPAPYPGYVCEFLAADKTVVTTLDCGKRSISEFTLSLLLPSARFAAGGYTMVLRPATDKRAEISRYSFTVRKEDQ